MSQIVDPTPAGMTIDQLLKLAANHVINAVRNRCVEHFPDEVARTAVNTVARGLGEVVNTAIDEHPGVPKTPMTAVELARHVGLLPPARKGRIGRR